MSVLRISKWAKVFETHESRKYSTLRWIALPISFSSNGYQSLLDEFGDDAPAIYGCWCALAAFAASCPRRGVLATSKGKPMRLSHIARTTGFDVKLFQRLVEWASEQSVAWLETMSESEVEELVIQLGESEDGQAKCSVFAQPAESPGDVPEDREKNTPTKPNQTKQNITKHHQTKPNQTTPIGGSDGLVDRWSMAKNDFVDSVREVANRFKKLKPFVFETLGRDFVWQCAWVGVELDRGIVDDLCDRLAKPGNGIVNAKSYVGKAMRNLCEEHGLAWESIRFQVPPAPPPSPTQVTIVADEKELVSA